MFFPNTFMYFYLFFLNLRISNFFPVILNHTFTTLTDLSQPKGRSLNRLPDLLGVLTVNVVLYGL